MEHDLSIRSGERTTRTSRAAQAILAGGVYGLKHSDVVGTVHAVGLILLAWALWRHGTKPIAFFLPLILSSSLFVGADIYVRGKTLTVLITGVVYTMTLLAPVIFDRKVSTRSLILRLVALSGVLVFLLNMRTTATAAAGGAVLLLLLYRQRRILSRLVLVGVLLASFVCLNKAFDAWWNIKVEQARHVVGSLGGRVYTGPTVLHHSVWHPIWCGLADFDTTHGYVWQDRQPRSYARKVMTEKGIEIEPGLGELVELSRHYAKIVRPKIISDIRQDPGWYLTILIKRVKRVLYENEPARLDLIVRNIVLPSGAVVVLALVCSLLMLRVAGYLKLAVAALPSASVAIVVTTCGGQQLLSIVHLVIIASGLSVLYQCAVSTRAALQRKSPSLLRYCRRTDDPEVMLVVASLVGFTLILLGIRPDRSVLNQAMSTFTARAAVKQEWLQNHPIADGCLMAYPFDQPRSEESTEAAPLEWKGQERFCEGKIGKAADFTGKNVAIVEEQMLHAEGSLLLWFNPSSSARREERILDANGYGIFLLQGRLTCLFNDGAPKRLSGSAAVLDNEWTHVALTWGKPGLQLYVNGHLDKSTIYSGSPRHSQRDVILGGRWNRKEMFFTGRLDELYLYRRCLTQDEIQDIMVNGVPDIHPLPREASTGKSPVQG
jgi:hypothetical protein